MMNVRLKLRLPKQLVVPKSPSFRWARTVRSDLDGTRVSFKAPRHRPRRSNHLPTFPEREYSSGNRLQERALAGLENTELVKDYPPLKWDKATPEQEQKYLNSGAA